MNDDDDNDVFTFVFRVKPAQRPKANNPKTSKELGTLSSSLSLPPRILLDFCFRVLPIHGNLIAFLIIC